MNRLLIVDDHPVVREGLKAFLDMQPDLQVVAEAGSLAELEALPDVRPDLVLIDLRLPDGNGLSALQRLKSLPGGPKVIVLTSYLDAGAVREAMRRGATGYLLKHAGPRELLDRIRAALRGEVPLDPAAIESLTTTERDPLEGLTPREREVLSHIAEGLTNHEIAELLGIAEKTVKSHAGNLFAKLGVDSRTQAAVLAKESGI